MILYAETNFVMELALLQEESATCEAICELFEEHPAAELVLPAFSLIEPFTTLDGRHRRRLQLEADLRRELLQLTRTESYNQHADAIGEVGGLLTKSTQEEQVRYRDTAQRLLSRSRVIPLTDAILRSAYEHEHGLALSLPDAIVLASVLSDLRSGPPPAAACFATRDVKGFGNPDVQAAIEALGCRLVFRFQHALDYSRAVLRGPSATS